MVTDEHGSALQVVAANVRRLRKARGMTQQELAERSGLSVEFVGQVERAEKSPSVTSLERLAGALESAIADFFDGRAVNPANDRDSLLVEVTDYLRVHAGEQELTQLLKVLKALRS